MSARVFTQLADVMLRNPFEVELQALDDLCRRVLWVFPGSWSLFPETVNAAAAEHGARLLLALAHSHALDADVREWMLREVGESWQLDTSAFTLAALEPFGSDAAFRECEASLHGLHRGLHAWPGEAAATRAVHAALWAACFGAELTAQGVYGFGAHRRCLVLMGETGVGMPRLIAALQASRVGAVAARDGESARELVARIAARAFVARDAASLTAPEQAALLLHLRGGQPAPVVLTATRPLSELSLREDLVRELEAEVLHVPSLRARNTDVLAVGRQLAHERFVTAGVGHEFWNMAPVMQRSGKVVTFPARTPMRTVTGHDRYLVRLIEWLGSSGPHETWPGNLDELDGVVRHFLAKGRPYERVSDGMKHVSSSEVVGEMQIPADIADGCASLETVTRWYKQKVLERASGERLRAAAVLGVRVADWDA